MGEYFKEEPKDKIKELQKGIYIIKEDLKRLESSIVGREEFEEGVFLATEDKNGEVFITKKLESVYREDDSE